MVRGGKHVGVRKPHMLFRNGLYRCFTLIWEGRHSVGIRLGLGHTINAAYNRWLDGGMVDSGATLYTRRL